MLKIKEIENGSLAQELGLKKNDIIEKINNKKMNDIIDFLAEETKSKIKLEIINNNNEHQVLVFKKDPLEGFGLEFYDNFEIKECHNNCVFCFVNQLPKGMRKSLYIKDDDYRLSFSEGNYVTLTNCSNQDIKRIISLKLSPLYISVHAITKRIRNSLLNNHSKLNILKTIKKLSKSIEIHAQIVLVPGFNDGVELKKTLIAIAPYVKSIAVVPVGLTQYRQGLPKLRPVDNIVANKTIEVVEELQKLCQKWFGERKIFAADELYIIAKREIPPFDTYENFYQIENGVGLIAKFVHEFDVALSELDQRVGNEKVSIATGKSAYGMMKSLIERLQHICKNVSVNLYEIENKFFGTNITVSGLIVGRDLIDQLANKDLGKKLLISKSMLREGSDVFLDDTTLEEVQNALGVKVVPIENNGAELLYQMVNKK